MYLVLHCVLCVPTIYPATALQEVKQPSKKRSPDQADKKLILGKYRTLEEVPREVQYSTVQYSTVQCHERYTPHHTQLVISATRIVERGLKHVDSEQVLLSTSRSGKGFDTHF